LECAGLAPGQIAELVEMDISRVSVILNDERADVDRQSILSQLAEQAADVHVSFKLLAKEALQELTDEMRNAEDARVRQKAALAILDRGGYSKYQGEHVPRPEVGDLAADRLIKAVQELKASPAPDYAQIEPKKIQEADYEIVEDRPVASGEAAD
jgi:hypothetical protein